MPTKNELLVNKIHKMKEYVKSEKLPFFNKLEEITEKQDTKTIVGLIEKFIIPQKDNLKEYILIELGRMKIYNSTLSNPDEDFDKWTPSDDQIDRIIKDIKYMVKVIEY